MPKKHHSGLPFRLWLAVFYQQYLCRTQMLTCQVHQSMRWLAAFANTVPPCNKSVYWQMMWRANLCLLQGVRCRLWQCCPWLVLSGSRSMGRGQPQIFSRPPLCLGRTAVILILLLVVVIVSYVHQFWHVLCTEVYKPLCLCWPPIHVLVLTPIFLMPIWAACPALAQLATALCAVVPVHPGSKRLFVWRRAFGGKKKMLLKSSTYS